MPGFAGMTQTGIENNMKEVTLEIFYTPSFKTMNPIEKRDSF